MSTEITEEYGEHRLTLTQYWGGDEKGLCIQLNGENCDRKTGHVGMTVRDAYDTAMELVKWIQSVAEEEADSLRDTIAKHKELERTIFSEAVECQHWIADMKILDIPLSLLGHGKKDI